MTCNYKCGTRIDYYFCHHQLHYFFLNSEVKDDMDEASILFALNCRKLPHHYVTPLYSSIIYVKKTFQSKFCTSTYDMSAFKILLPYLCWFIGHRPENDGRKWISCSHHVVLHYTKNIWKKKVCAFRWFINVPHLILGPHIKWYPC